MKSFFIALLSLFAICIFILFVAIFWYSMLTKNVYISECEQLVNQILSDTAKSISKKYKIRVSGEGASMPGRVVKQLTLIFTANNSYNQAKLRELLITFAEELLKNVNEEKEIQQYLIQTPFTIENVEITIYNHDKNNREIYDPEISTASIAAGILTYRRYDPINRYRIKNEFKETYEEALKWLAEQNHKTPNQG